MTNALADEELRRFARMLAWVPPGRGRGSSRAWLKGRNLLVEHGGRQHQTSIGEDHGCCR